MHSDSAHTLTIYEASPLNRTASVTPPSWHTTNIEYGANTGFIRDHYNSFTFSPDELNTQTVTDPDGNQAISFSDKRGRTVLVRQDSVNSSKNNDTYTTFDPKNRKILVLPPGTELHPFPTYPDLVYTYLYDHLDQVIDQKIPGREIIETVYEPNRDYPVAWRGGNLRADRKWMVTAYDDYGREKTNRAN